MPTYVASDYEGITRAIITAWKERGRRDVAVHLAHALSVALRAVVSEEDGRADRDGPHLTVVPIPSSPAARRRRGEDAWDRVVRLALAEVSRHCRIDVARCLQLTRQPRDQAGLSAPERRANLAGALVCRTAPRTPIVLVDDIVTTGATLTEGARALRAAGGEVRWAAAMTATSRAIG
jgi:predicted amidophosphoribosyltransferase